MVQIQNNIHNVKEKLTYFGLGKKNFTKKQSSHLPEEDSYLTGITFVNVTPITLQLYPRYVVFFS